MKRLAVLLPFLALFLVGCNENGYPNTDVEAIVIGVVTGVVSLAVIAAFAFVIWWGLRE